MSGKLPVFFMRELEGERSQEIAQNRIILNTRIKALEVLLKVNDYIYKNRDGLNNEMVPVCISALGKIAKIQDNFDNIYYSRLKEIKLSFDRILTIISESPTCNLDQNDREEITRILDDVIILEPQPSFGM